MEKKTNILCMKIKFKDQLEKIVKKKAGQKYLQNKISIYFICVAGNTTGLAHTESPKQSERDVKCISLKPTSCGRWWWWAVGCKFTRFTDTDKTSQWSFFRRFRGKG